METPAQRLTQAVEDFLLRIIIVKVDWEARPAPDKWSAKEIVGHLLDSANINLHRFVRCTYEQNFKLEYAQNEWVAAQQYQTANADDLLRMFKLQNRQISRILENYAPGAWQHTCDTGHGQVTVAYLANDYVAHLQQHLRQIVR